MDSITEYLTSSGGYARMKELRSAGFQSRKISALVDRGDIERVKPGLYRLAGYGESSEHAGLAEVCEVQISYAIGVAEPISVLVSTEGTGKISDEAITELVLNHFDLRPKGIVNMLDLLRPIYQKTAYYGHFGREEPEFTWEKTDKAEVLRADAGL